MENKNSTDKTIYDYLEEYFKNNNWQKNSVKAFYADFEKAYPYEGKTPSNFKRLFEEFTVNKDGKEMETRQIARRNVVRLAILMGIPRKAFEQAFDIPLDIVHPLPIKPQFMPINYQTDPYFEENYHSFIIDEYFGSRSQFDEFVVHDYLGRGDKDVPTKNMRKYFSPHEKIFKYIEYIIKNRILISYSRILGLHIKETKQVGFKAVANKILQQCSAELFEHICQCLFNTQIGHKSAKFYVTSTPSRTYQYALLKTKLEAYIYEEHYKLDDKGNAWPSFVTKDWQSLKENKAYIYDGEIEKHIDKNEYFSYSPNSSEADPETDIVTCFKDAMNIKNYDIQNVKDKDVPRLRRTVKAKIKTFNKVFSEDVEMPF